MRFGDDVAAAQVMTPVSSSYEISMELWYVTNLENKFKLI